MIEIYPQLLRAWLTAHIRAALRNPDRGDGIVNAVVLTVGFVTIALICLAIFKGKSTDASNNLPLQNPNP